MSLMFFGLDISTFFQFILYISSPASFPKPLSSAQEKQYIELLKNKDPQARNILIERNLRLVAHVIKKYHGTCPEHEQEDLISIGTIGLIKAIDSFDCDKGARLATYAAKCIENEILMYFRNLKKTSSEISINDPIDTDKNGNTLTLIDIIAEEDNIVERIDTKIKLERLSKILDKTLTQREKTIIVLRYGLCFMKPLTQRETAAKIGISRSYVSRIEKAALKKLHRAINSAVD